MNRMKRQLFSVELLTVLYPIGVVRAEIFVRPARRPSGPRAACLPSAQAWLVAGRVGLVTREQSLPELLEFAHDHVNCKDCSPQLLRDILAW